jgi:hypothetical protein
VLVPNSLLEIGGFARDTRWDSKPQAQLASAPEATSNKWPEVSGFLQALSLHAAVLQSPDGAP